jgi:hypothetical protein
MAQARTSVTQSAVQASLQLLPVLLVLPNADAAPTRLH